MKTCKIAVMGFSWILLSTVALGGGCSSDPDKPNTPEPLAPPTVEPDIEPVDVKASFTITIDTAHVALDKVTMEAIETPVVVEGSGTGYRLRAFAKRVAARPELVWMELYFENLGTSALRDVRVDIDAMEGANELYDLTVDPFAPATTSRTLEIARIAPEGVSRLFVGVPATGAAVKINLSVNGIATKRISTSSASVVVTPDGTEAWIPIPDADMVAVLDTVTDTRIAQVPVVGRPRSIGITPDGKLVLVASAQSNVVSVIDRATRKVVQSLGESDGVGREPRNIVISPDGSRAFVSAYVGDTITSMVRHDSTYRVEATLPVGRRPTGMSVSPDGTTLLVSHFLPRGILTKNEGWISVVETNPLRMAREVAVHDHVNSDSAACAAKAFGVSTSRMVSEGVPSQFAGVFLNPAGTEGWTPGTRVAGAAIAWERGANPSSMLTDLTAIPPGELVPPFVFLFDTRNSLESQRLQSPGAVERPVSIDYVKCAQFQQELEWVSRDIIPSDPTQQANRFLAFPTGYSGLTESGIAHFIGFTRGGRRALVLSHAADEVIVVDAMTHHPTAQLHFQLSGSNPSGLAVTPDGKKAYVAYENSMFASVLDLSAYAGAELPTPSHIPYEYRAVPDISQVGVAFGSKLLVRHIGGVAERPDIKELSTAMLVDADPMDSKRRRGKVLFNSSNPDKHPTLSRSREGACASCHPDGGADGSAWATMEGERRTLGLRGGTAGRGWLHASGTHQDAHEFAAIITKERLGGSLDDVDVNALADYIAFGVAHLQHPSVDEALAEKGKAIFATKCSGCHMGDALTSGNPVASNPWGGGAESGPTLYDIGTMTNDAHVALAPFFESLLPALESQILKELRGDRDLGPNDFVQQTLDFRPRPVRKASEFKAPSLVNVWDNVVFFHDGRFDKLEDVVKYFNTKLTLNMTADDQKAVIEYLKTL